LNGIIQHQQQQQHAVIVMLDVNQSISECFKGQTVKPYSIECLCLQQGMEDPFIKLLNSRPNSTTIIPNRDIDYVLTYGIDIVNISTLHQNNPCNLDHLGIVFDIDLENFFRSSYSDLSSMSPRLLTSGNLNTVNKYIKYVSVQVFLHKLDKKVYTLADKAEMDLSSLPRMMQPH
jgi:hypothetical protein